MIKSTRAEYKYFVPYSRYEMLLADLNKFTTPDSYSDTARGYYRISSIYFENVRNQMYFEKIDGIAKRAKFRLRFYSTTPNKVYFVESKFKLFNRYIKRKTILRTERIDDILSPFAKNNGVLGQRELDEFLYYAKIYNFYPYIRIDYERKAVFDKFDKNIRITFDRNIKCCRFSAGDLRFPDIPTFPGETVILEIKTNLSFPYWLSYIIKKYSLERRSISKYVISVQRLTFNSTFSVK